MKKLALAGLFSIIAFCIPSRAHAVPLDVPYGNTLVGGAVSGVVLSSSSLPNSNYQWCISHVVVSAQNNATFSMYFSSMSTLTPSTTNFVVVVSSGTPFNNSWNYRTPYCIPKGDYLGMDSSVTGSTITYEGYSFGGWNNY